ncbi:Aldose 1-epimerase [Gluconacetobacter diazotrophicus PA1 5]|uniref:Aldose 1-epimerase n=2 Tax=Gluconacetobacter diazotrophicus TaxID=33996 RepID=A9HBF6_GLUDA|nr:aldose epimerase family protein [Gluconacetobacter diazotrophicus]ACI50936.1 Aldose 1-epimerase [Gluconacetobacter diazotrophicus PA1 5]MBB2156129.1 galactose mutarotase [Gluconacetobacter diazotrophicus]TWB08609.1 aldose 1-epimerase [Gluconacetobacter diazotrophicus]CAP54809.1 putative aldose 1-epimerase precursor [Gluconacetobacter diazotrophicus PA1 5]
MLRISPTRLATSLLAATALVSATLASATPVRAADAPVALARAGFGTMADGKPVEILTLRNAHGVSVRFITYGGIITAIDTPDRTGHTDDIVLGFPDLQGYTVDSAQGGLFFGAMIGRYANRIARGTFTLDGATYHVPVTAPPNALHGGTRGFDKHLWTVDGTATDAHSASATLSLTSPDGDQGFPGTLKVSVTYTLDDQDRLTLHYRATTDKPTVLNLTNHSYFNLGGEGSGSIEDEILQINADHFTPTDPTAIPTGDIAPVAGTPLDFRKPMRIGVHLRDSYPQLMFARGYDHNWVVNGPAGAAPRPAAHIVDPRTGRTMDVLTSQPGLQVYTSNSLDGAYAGVSHRAYRQTDAIAFEAEHYPDSPNHPSFPTTTLRPGETFDYTTIFHFGVQPAAPRHGQ